MVFLLLLLVDLLIVLFTMVDFLLPLIVQNVGSFDVAAIFRLLRMFRAIRALRALRVLRTIRSESSYTDECFLGRDEGHVELDYFSLNRGVSCFGLTINGKCESWFHLKISFVKEVRNQFLENLNFSIHFL